MQGQARGPLKPLFFLVIRLGQVVLARLHDHMAGRASPKTSAGVQDVDPVAKSTIQYGLPYTGFKGLIHREEGDSSHGYPLLLLGTGAAPDGFTHQDFGQSQSHLVQLTRDLLNLERVLGLEHFLQLRDLQLDRFRLLGTQ